MARSSPGGPAAKPEACSPPAQSRITMRPRKNRRRASSLWSRVPPPRAMADACGRAVRRSLSTLVGAAVLASVVAAGWCAYHFVTTSPRFAIADIEVRGGAHESADALIARLPVQPGDNIFAASPGDVAAALLADPWIATAEVHRVLPRTLVVEVSEHVPAALVDFEAAGLYLVDAAGHPFKRASIAVGEGAGLPVITGVQRAVLAADPDGTARTIADALAALATWRARGDRPAIGEVHLGARGELTLRGFDDAVAIQLGVPGGDLATRLDSFDAAWAELGDAEKATARAVHVDSQPDHVTIAFD